MDNRDPDVLDLGGYLAVLGRQRWIVFATFATVVIVAMVVTLFQSPAYEASVKIAVQPPSQGSDLEQIIFGATPLGTQQEILTSTALIRGVLEAHDLPAEESDIDDFLEGNVDVERVSDTTVLEVSVSAPQPRLAASLAQGMAEAYLGYLQRDARERTAEATTDLDTAEETTRRELRSVENQLAQGAGSTEESLEERRDALYAQLRWLSTRRTELETATAFMRRGEIIQPAIVPDEPSSPKPLRTGALAIVLGAMLGVGVAFLRDFTDDRVRDESELLAAAGVPLLGDIPEMRSEPEPVVRTTPLGAASDAYRRLRTNIVAAPRAAGGVGMLLALAPAGQQGDAAAVAVNLAICLVRSGRRVALVDADLARGSAGSLLGVEGQGLDELLSHDIATESARHEPIPGLQFVPAGATSAGARERLASAAFGRLVEDLGGDADDVLIVVPPTGAGADALDVAVQIGAILLVVTPLQTRKTEVGDAVDDLQRVGATVIGTVLDRSLDRKLERSTGRRDRRQPKQDETSGDAVRDDGSIAAPGTRGRTGVG